jgi:hypothetical protein
VKLLERVRVTMRRRRYSHRTEDSYVDWMRRYITFHGMRHPGEMGGAEVVAFLNDLTRRGLSSSSQTSCTGMSSRSRSAASTWSAPGGPPGSRWC